MIRQHTTSNGSIIEIEVTEVGHFHSEEFSFKVVEEEYKGRKQKAVMVEKFPDHVGENQIDKIVKTLNLLKELL